jgi:putative ABC transport system permease protein
MALGAPAGSVLAGVLGRAARLVTIGIAVGLAGARAISQVFESLVVDITVTDTRIYLGAAAALFAIGLIAAFAPALRASRVDPLVALRAE